MGQVPQQSEEIHAVLCIPSAHAGNETVLRHKGASVELTSVFAAVFKLDELPSPCAYMYGYNS